MLEIRYVEWLDSNGTGSWTTFKELREEKPAFCQSVGYVLTETEDAVSLLQSVFMAVSEDRLDSGMHHLIIPKVAITKQETLREAS